MKTSRRDFLQISVAAGAALFVGSKVPDLLAQSGAAEFAPNAYIRIGSDDTIRLSVTRSEMGQGVRTALPMMLADELDVDWTKIIVEQAAAAPRFKGIRLRTSGSGSAVGTWKSLRTAGAAAREMLTERLPAFNDFMLYRQADEAPGRSCHRYRQVRIWSRCSSAGDAESGNGAVPVHRWKAHQIRRS